MISVGIDMVEIERIKKSMENSRFLDRILGEKEYLQLKSKGFPVQSVAANFCAKEAFSKAVGTGFRGIKFREVEILRNEISKPFIHLTGKAFDLYGNNENQFSVSVTHTKQMASAVVVFSKNS